MLPSSSFEAGAAALLGLSLLGFLLLLVWRRRSQAHSDASVAIVGGSFAGIGVARHLGSGTTVFERQCCIEYTPGILRSYVDGEHFKRLGADVTAALPKCQVVQAAVSGLTLTDDGVRVKYSVGKHFDANAVVIATGSSYPIAKADSDSAVHGAMPRSQQIKEVAARIRDSASILLVGGGPVGVELAGELVHAYGVSKRISLLSSTATLLEGLHPCLGREAQAWLEARGVQVALQDGVQVPPGEGPHSLPCSVPGRTLLTRQGVRVEAALVIPCVGARAGTGWIGQEKGRGGEALVGSLDDRGRIRVNSCFEVCGLEGRGVFACGDCASHPALEPALAHTAEKQAGVVALNVRRHLHNLAAKARGESTLPLLSYPESVSGPNPLANPIILCISLGPWHALLDFNGRIILADPWIGQRLAGVVKRVIEASKVDEMRGGWAGCTFWSVADVLATAVSRYCVPRLKQEKEARGSKRH